MCTCLEISYTHTHTHTQTYKHISQAEPRKKSHPHPRLLTWLLTGTKYRAVEKGHWRSSLRPPALHVGVFRGMGSPRTNMVST
jgi:hypothetical protein